MEELGQRLLEHPDAGIDGGKGTVDNRARAARGMFTEEASASPLTLTAREQVPKFADLLWHCFGGGLEVPEVPRSEDPAAPASSRALPPSRKKAPTDGTTDTDGGTTINGMFTM